VSNGGPAPTGSGRTSDANTGGVLLEAEVQGRQLRVTLPAEVPAAVTGMPVPASVFAGRDELVALLLGRLAPGGEGGTTLVSAAAGMAGIGTTELVLQTAARALRIPGWFPGGVVFVDLFGYDPDRRLSAVDALWRWLRAVGIPGERIPAGEQARARLWRSVVAAYVRQGRRLLVVIDNAADAAQVIPLLPADPSVPVLVTSRHALDIGARQHTLDVLDDAAAVDVISRVVASRRGGAVSWDAPGEREAVAELAGLCAGLPLALRIVAALLADHPQPAALAASLRDARDRPDQPAEPENPGMLATRAAADLSYRRLTPRHSRVYRLLPLDPGPDVSTVSAAWLVDMPVGEVAELLQDLRRAHLVDEPTTNRWRMYDLVRLHAASQPPPPRSPGEVMVALRRLYLYYHDTARAAVSHLNPAATTDTTVFATREQALAWLEAERANLVAVCATATRHHLSQISTGLPFVLAGYLHLRRHLDDWITIATRAADVSHEAGHWNDEGAALTLLGRALTEAGRFDEAVTAYTRAADICHQGGDRRRGSRALELLGGLLTRAGRFDEAATAYSRAAGIFRDSGDRRSEGRVLDLLGAALAEAGRLDEAITAFSRQLEVYVELGDRYGEGEARGNLGAVLGEAGRFEEAIDVLTRAVDIFRGLGDRRNEGRSLGMLGAALAEVGRFDEARECWERATSMLAELGDAAWIEVIREFAGELLPAAESGEPQGTPSQPRPAE